jgi:hypothetical protein
MEKRNYTFILFALAVLLFGFALLSSSSEHDATNWDPSVFNKVSMNIAPMVLLIGYTMVGFAIFLKPKTQEN